MPDVLGFARVSTAGQDLEAQRRRLKAEGGALRVFEDIASGQSFDRPGLVALLDYARLGDAVCVVRLDRLVGATPRVLHSYSSPRRLEQEWYTSYHAVQPTSAPSGRKPQTVS
jgi:DNA invertase Pin-like site-specific DNA recombinase